MQRRKYLIGLGSLAGGGAAAVGSGAFTSVEADRSVDVEVAGDSSAYLALRKAANDNNGTINDPGANSDEYVDVSGSEVSFDFTTSTANGGSGFNPNSVTVIEDLIEVQNQGTQNAFLSVDLSSLDVTDGSGGEASIELAVSNPDDASSNPDTQQEPNIAFQGSGSAVGSNATSPASYDLGAGDTVHLDLTVDTTTFNNANVSTSGSVTFIADQTSGL